MNQTRTLPELDPALDFDIPCDVPTCERSAAWLAVMSCCGDNGFHCVECAVNLRVRIASVFAGPSLITCGTCGTFLASPRDVRWEPVR